MRPPAFRVDGVLFYEFKIYIYIYIKTSIRVTLLSESNEIDYLYKHIWICCKERAIDVNFPLGRFNLGEENVEIISIM